MKASKNLEKKSPSDAYWRVQLLYMKVQVYSSLELPQEYNQNHTNLTNQNFLWPF